MRVHVGTGSPLKVEAVRQAFADAFPGEPIDIRAVAVATGIRPQPFGAEVTRGAKARAEAALDDADFGVGIEAGLVGLLGTDRLMSVQVCVIADRSGRSTFGHGPGYELPAEVVRSLQEGASLNEEMSRISGIPEIKETIGAIGYLSEGRITRLAVTREAVLMALLPRLTPDWT
jgi:inosine/xanthosine triphosphatase